MKITSKFDFESFQCGAILNYEEIISVYAIKIFFNNMVTYIFNLICEILVPEHPYFVACKSSNFESIVNYL